MFAILHLLFCIISLCSSTQYVPQLGSYALNISQATYCSQSSDWTCVTCNPEIELYDINEHGGVRVITALDHNKKYILVGFRGSSNIQNWIDNLQFSHIEPYEGYPSIKIDKGFYKALNEIRENLYNNIFTLHNKFTKYTIFITGHSLGGSLSSITAFELIYLHQISPESIQLITFGSPRVGNTDFRDYMSSLYLSWRITHYYDIVPHVPEEFMGYIHIPGEIWYNRENTEYKICKNLDDIEDETCSDSCAPTKCTSIDDHMTYLNLSLGSDGIC